MFALVGDHDHSHGEEHAPEAQPSEAQGGPADALAIALPLCPRTLALLSNINGVFDHVNTFIGHLDAWLNELSRQVDVHFIKLEEQIAMLLSQFLPSPQPPSDL
ncbi:hypothetical protein GOBAR_AA11704 [Gossypium barbadense]|uniref:Uncharacterized protein n=1 Tax=Gossypium barbadense TaxID=3634 RepID=A0A2P5Y012_GOSBA|nr:hypothetical protein GOBAR_AA11704 [Gossypium barbadense]